MKIFFSTLALCLILTNNIYSQENRAIWVVRDALTHNNFLSIIDNAKNLKCNKIFLQLRALGKVYYPTKLDIPKYKVNEKLFIQLLKEAKENNIEVHAWLNFSYVNSEKNNQIVKNHILNKSSNSVIYSPVTGVKSEGYFLHPNDEKNLSEVKNIVKELIDKYQISGIHLDYFRYPKDLSHTSKSSRTSYILKYGLDPIVAINNPDIFIEKRGLEVYNSFKESYSNFLRDELTLALGGIKELIGKTNKKVQLSVAVKPNPLKAKHMFYQDWKFWVEKGFCDFVVTMSYNPDEKIFNSNIAIMKSMIPKEKVMIGIAAYNIEKEQVIKRIRQVNSLGFSGYSIFSYNYIREKIDIYNYLEESL